jgi:hypothetical protein
MNSRVRTSGKTRTCPHCKTTILESASVCPGCNHHLRFGPGAGAQAKPAFTALRVEGAIRNDASADGWEYSVVVSIRNERGEEVARKVVGVGALDPRESRTVMLAVDVFTPGGTK